jgi:hypothetical protein
MGRKKRELTVDFPYWNEFHPSFLEKMVNQLDESGSKLLGEPLINCICGFVIDGVDVLFDNDGNGYTLVSIVAWSNMGKKVTIRWSSPTKKRISPITDVKELDITFNWCTDFPLDELKRVSKKKTKKTVVVDSETFPFDVEYSGFIEADILLEVALSNQGSDEEKQQIVDTLKEAYESWNIEAEKNNTQFIKFMRYIRKIRNKYVFYFDLGSSGNEAIHFMIKSLATNNNLFISKVFVKQS